MKFEKATPAVSSLKDLHDFDNFLQQGQNQLYNFLKNFLNIKQVRLQTSGIEKIKEWLEVDEISEIMEVPGKSDEICVVSQIKSSQGIVAYFP